MSVLSKVKVSLFHNLFVKNSEEIMGQSWGVLGKRVFKNSKAIHKATSLNYPRTRPLPLPNNVEDIAGSEKARFSPLRARDINGSLICGDVFQTSLDTRIFSYDCNGSVSLNSAMQSNVPQPCLEQDLYTHFNMPGGLWRQGDKYVAADFLKSSMLVRHYSTKKQVEEENDNNKKDYSTLSRKDKLKTAVKEYGSVVIVFHVGISLVSLGISYLAVTSGIDFSSLLEKWQSTEGAVAASSAAPFVVAYAIHKMFAPVRISITLISVPFIVKYLRRVGFIKPPKTTKK